MADQKISQLTSLTGANTASGDLVTIVDISDTTMGASGTNKKMTLTEFQASPVSAGTANGVVYLNGSKVATAGSALTFDGTNLATTGTASATKLIPTGGTATGNGMYLPSANTLGFSTNGVLGMSLNASGNLGLNTTTFGTSAAGVLALANGTAPTTGPADTVQIFSVDRSAGNTIPAIYCEGSGVTNAGITNTTVTNKIAIQVNGTIYYLLATTNAT
jgi:hypothetical protein